MALTIYKDSNTNFMLMQSSWAANINPFLINPTNNKSIIKDVTLINGSNIINHLLGRVLQGWSITRKKGNANIYDTQDSNPRPQFSLVLVSSAAVTVDIEVF